MADCPACGRDTPGVEGICWACFLKFSGPAGPFPKHLGKALRKIGFTGTHRHMTLAAVFALDRRMATRGRCELHHGDCVEADATAHQRAQTRGWRTVIHPGPSIELRAWCNGDVLWPVRPNLARNADIVNDTGELLAVPFGFEEELRSGTWATIRLARKLDRPVTYFWPDGTVTNG